MVKQERFGKIVGADKSGDSVIATFTPGVFSEDVEIACGEAIDTFLDVIYNDRGQRPPLWGVPIIGLDDTAVPFKRGTDRFCDFKTVLVQPTPIVGG